MWRDSDRYGARRWTKSKRMRHQIFTRYPIDGRTILSAVKGTRKPTHVGGMAHQVPSYGQQFDQRGAVLKLHRCIQIRFLCSGICTLTCMPSFKSPITSSKVSSASSHRKLSSPPRSTCTCDKCETRNTRHTEIKRSSKPTGHSFKTDTTHPAITAQMHASHRRAVLTSWLRLDILWRPLGSRALTTSVAHHLPPQPDRLHCSLPQDCIYQGHASRQRRVSHRV